MPLGLLGFGFQRGPRASNRWLCRKPRKVEMARGVMGYGHTIPKPLVDFEYDERRILENSRILPARGGFVGRFEHGANILTDADEDAAGWRQP